MLILPGVKMPENCFECDALGISDIVGLHCPCDFDPNIFNSDKRPKYCVLRETPSFPDYDELLEAARAMHTWIFLNSGDEKMAYKMCGLSDEMNAFLGYDSGSFIIPIHDGWEE